VKPVYGITRPVQTWNPIKINFMHLWLLTKDAWNTKNTKDKFRVWLMPTGWRPADVIEKHPVFKIEDVYAFDKYETKSSSSFLTWIWIQITILLLLVSYFFAHIGDIKSPGIFVYGGFIFLYVYAFTELMDRNQYAWIWELVKGTFGLGIIIYLGDWFGSNQYFPYLNFIFITYFFASTVLSFYFTFWESKMDVSFVRK
jgi:alkylglycerol monooxygenase